MKAQHIHNFVSKLREVHVYCLESKDKQTYRIIRLLLVEQSDQGFHCLLLHLHLLKTFLCYNAHFVRILG